MAAVGKVIDLTGHNIAIGSWHDPKHIPYSPETHVKNDSKPLKLILSLS